ncbi:GNAT family N-acetyltransferase [Rarobacter incanus]|uniref:Ribosomal protein S18 acetylase RimI-like enzyme n=1 Tax=Rarobacter incanus TaxID=153494 RepID=A0A542SRI3_9MICO|nr:GNAT family N-acetyltransferase [Rarobacter incanus]TQK77230.1 ribosomal protein S18 acetylase RimI-like enzyme [Rarobacter incanus]
MRLTNVAHLRLPFGRLLCYQTVAAGKRGDLPISFDQRRHVLAGDRDGSWMALSFQLSAAANRAELAAAWHAVVERHGTLRTVFEIDEAQALRLREVTALPGAWEEHTIAPGQSVNDALRAVLDARCRPLSQPSHALCVLETADGPTVVIAVDHSHVDMWSMLAILRDFLAALAAARDGIGPQLPPAPSFTEHTRALARRPRAPQDVRGRWQEILAASDNAMPRFPLPLGDPTPQLERVEVRDVLDVDDAAAFSAQARVEAVSTLSLAVSAMTAITRELAGTPLRAVFPVHSRYDATWHDSAGWFITNSVIESGDPAPAACAAAVKEAIRLGSWPLADIMEPWGGMPEAPGMFAISWLDLRRLPVQVDAAGLQAQYVGASIRTDGVMLWFILDQSGLHLRCRYPDTKLAREHVGGWLDALVERLRATARTSVRSHLKVGDESFTIARAGRADVADIVALLVDDELGRHREMDETAAYLAAYDVVVLDRSQHLAIVRDSRGRAAGTMQLSLIPGLTRGGATRLQIEGLRVAATRRSRGLGSAMLEWAHEYGRTRGAQLAQVTTDEVRARARAFYARHGYDTKHVGLKRTL